MTKRRGPRPLHKRVLRRILGRFGCKISLNRGRGAHWCAERMTEDGRKLYPFPSKREISLRYISAGRRHLRLDPEHGVSDEEFFNA